MGFAEFTLPPYNIHMVTLYNTLTKKKEIFTPAKAKKVGMYACGPTVYGPAHIGNLRSYVFEDILKRTLLTEGYKVRHIINITDVGHLTSDADEGEDKMEKGAKREHKTVWEIAKQYTEEFTQDLKALNILPPSKFVKATDHIHEQIRLIERLEKGGYTYQTSDGIYFDTSKFPSYGDFARLNTAQQKEGARVAVNSEKKNPTDFALWKFSPANEKRQMEWKSSWGKGFPGWHIECSAMSMKYLGETFDIHCGGVDHIPIHHTNEIAQSEAATGKPLARFWLHNEFLSVDNNKMSKSLNNTYPLSVLTAKGYTPLAFRYFLLGAHYRSKLNFTWKALDASSVAFQKLIGFMQMGKKTKATNPVFYKKFLGAMLDDLNTPQALAVVWEIMKSSLPADEKRGTIAACDELLGLGLASCKPIRIPAAIDKLIAERENARQAKKFSEADALRKKIESKGFSIDDSEAGPIIKMHT